MPLPHVTIEPAAPADHEAVLGLLEEAGLPSDGLADYWDTVLVARLAGRVVGCAAVEIYGDGALLRSVAVSADCRGEGVGVVLTEAALALAGEWGGGAQAVFLLTETASEFFRRFGFRTVSRDGVPSGVRNSLEFTTLCPSGARAMALRLKP